MIDMHINHIVDALKTSPYFCFQDEPNSLYLNKGICPSCGKKSLYVSKAKPFVLDCNHKNKCGYSESVRDALPDLFEDMAKKHPPTKENRNATADAYLGFNRFFDLSKIRGWYEQAAFQVPYSQTIVPSVRFYLDAGRKRYWERIIGKADSVDRKAHFAGEKKEDGSLYRGDVWAPPGLTLARMEECYIVEGIFHAIALFHVGIKAVAALSCNNFPTNFFEAHAKKCVKWVWALDGDNAGRTAMRKHHKTLKAMGELSTAALASETRDWDDLYREGKLTPAFLAKCKHNGRLFLAESVEEKAYYAFIKHGRTSQIIDFENALYDIKLGQEFMQEIESLVETFRFNDATTKAEEKTQEQINAPTKPTDANSAAVEPVEPVPKKTIDPREEALLSKEGRELWRLKVQVNKISNVWPRFLYMSRNDLLDEQRYVFSVDYANGQGRDIVELEGSSITAPDAFHKALLNRTRGGTFDGDARQLKILRSWWLDSRMLTVSAIPYVGYDKGVNAYIFQDHAWHNGRRIDVNKECYFNIKNYGIKSDLKNTPFNTGGKFSPDWIENYAQAFSWQGMALLSFWLGSLFVQQIRAKHKSFPFFEFTGEPGAGKSTALEFCWKLVGRDEYEGIDLLKATIAARCRAFSQVSNLPVVVIESDRDNGEKDAKQKQFGWDEMKPFWNGRGTGALGVAKRGNDTEESVFQASLIISQNAEVDGSEALLQRIVHCHADKQHHKPGTREIARWFERQTSDSVGGFLGAALARERDILATFDETFERMEQRFSNSDKLKNERIIKNHAQIAACAECLRLLFPSMSQKTVEAIADYLHGRAVIRESRLGADHPAIEAFWEAYDYVNSRGATLEQLNHSKDTDTLIAINLNHFREKCIDYNQAYPGLGILKKLLPYSKRHKFAENNVAVASRFERKTIKCWVFEKGGRA